VAQHQGVPGHAAAVAEPHGALGAVRLEGDDVAGGDHLDAEPGRLPPGPLGQLAAADAVGEPEVVLDAAALAGLPAGRLALDEHRPQPLGGAVDGGAQPGRAAAHHDQVVELLAGVDVQPDDRGQLGVRGRHQRPPVGGDDHGDVVRTGTRGGEQPLALGLVRAVPAVRDGVAGQQVPGVERRRRPPVADQLDLVRAAPAGGLPALEHRVDDRVELLVDRLPGLEQVLVDVDDVDRPDRGLGVGVGGEQGAPGAREEVHRPLEEVDAVHLRHPVVGEEHRDLVAAQLQLPEGVERLRGRRGPQHPVRLAVAAAQVAGDRAGDVGVVVHAEQDRLVHGASVPGTGWPGTG
jgi:hypothetical protein